MAQDVTLPEWSEPLFRYTWSVWFLYGGRGSGKSHTVAIGLLVLVRMQKTGNPLRILCLREFLKNLDDSSKQLLHDKIRLFGWEGEFKITDTEILHLRTGSRFIFRGMKNGGSLRSLEGVDIVWGDEAQYFSESSLRSLFPTIRKEGSRLIFTFNPEQATDPIWKRMQARMKANPDRTVATNVNWRDNPFFTSRLEEERLTDLAADPDKYRHVWEGEFLTLSNAIIFSGKVDLNQEFEAPQPWETTFWYGADFGYSPDPATLVRCWVDENNDLLIDYAAFGKEVSLPDIKTLYSTVPGSKDWLIQADNARPDIIDMLSSEFRIVGAPKGPGSIEAGIMFMRSFRRIRVHSRCKELAQEFLRYSYKVDPKTEIVLPVIVDRYNHGIDALRYALTPLMRAQVPVVMSDEELAQMDMEEAYGY